MKQIKNKIFGRIFTRYPALVNLWARHSKFIEFSDSPWTPLTKAIHQCRLSLVTTGGVHLRSQHPFDMNDPNGDPTFREIPADTSPTDLDITHDYYDHTDADRDINVVFPVERVLELKNIGEIGDVNHRHFSFMGHIKDPYISTLLNDTAPKVASALKTDGVDIAILTPAWGICNQSVGLIQRAIETAGVATISITLSEEITKKIRPPRALWPGFQLGHPLGYPDQADCQLQVLRTMLKLLAELESPGTIIKKNMTGNSVNVSACLPRFNTGINNSRNIGP